MGKPHAIALKGLNDTHILLAELRGAGKTVKFCLQHLEISMQMYRNCMATEEFQDLVAERRRAFVERILKDNLEDPVRAEVRSAVPNAIKRAKQIMETGEDSEANKAIKTILDVGVGAKIEHNKTVTGVQINITKGQDSKLDELEEQMKRREKDAKRIGLRKDRGVIDLPQVFEDSES